MTLLTDNATPGGAAPGGAAPAAILPPEVEFILSALEAGQFSGANRRKENRRRYWVEATLKLFSDTPQTPPWILYTRDVSHQGLGFVTRHRLPLGYGGILTITSPQGKSVSIDCTLLRCREAVSGWFEGSMYFNREQPGFHPDFLDVGQR
jgi:PilZ domain